MRRSELERMLRELGWVRTDFTGILGHSQWKHPNRRTALALPNEELILDRVAELIIENAHRVRR